MVRDMPTGNTPLITTDLYELPLGQRDLGPPGRRRQHQQRLVGLRTTRPAPPANPPATPSTISTATGRTSHGYLEGYHPPGIANPVLWKRAGEALLEARFAGVRVVRAEADSRTGLAVQLPLLAPARDDDACRTLHEVMRYEIVDRYLDGLAGPDRGDWLGVQYYRKQWVDPASPTPRPRACPAGDRPG